MSDFKPLFVVAGMIVAGGLVVAIALLSAGGGDSEISPNPAAHGSGTGTAAAPDLPVESLRSEIRAKDARIRELEQKISESAAPAGLAGDAETAKLRERNAELEKTVEELKSLLPRERQGKGVYRFGLKSDTPFLDKADWPVLSKQFVELKDIIRTIFDEFSRTGKIETRTQLAVQKKNMPMAIFAVGASNDIEGVGPNASFTHPAVMANFIREILAQAGQPLTASQDETVRKAGEAWVEREKWRKGRYDDSTLALTKMIDDADSKQRFIDDVRAALTPAQVSVMFNPEIDGRGSLDLFSPALQWVMREPVTGTSRESLEKSLLKEFFEFMDFELDQAIFGWLAAEWLDRIPEALEPVSEEDYKVDITFPRLERLQKCARAQAHAMRRLIDMRHVNDEQAKALRELTALAVPQVIVPAEKKE